MRPHFAGISPRSVVNVIRVDSIDPDEDSVHALTQKFRSLLHRYVHNDTVRDVGMLMTFWSIVAIRHLFAHRPNVTASRLCKKSRNRGDVTVTASQLEAWK